ncbi:tRNA glutamyl-Q(34) synthetase GluQRS [Nitrospirillum sp. BR 11752]|uniref:tRNA glutamyl-Q(34) synthetase GluQRS n=1 Tax=Nitrospirillum sp. BR 11752 TaxID=3104293 RepID=UPI002ECDD112|nr:tRNA glutamyl-Q(34) synthetase GluQRS [Nitrospirillum sp. BR 11752]
MNQTVTRFAPSPTGLPHLGHAYSALFGWDAARRAGGTFLLRFEDIDPNRCRPEFEEAFLRDLAWLGLSWPQPVRRQSEHMADYRAALDRLSDLGVLYPCFCSRKDIQDEIARAGAAPHGPEGPLYPGTCRHMDPVRRADLLAAGAPHALRLDVAAATRRAGPLLWTDLEAGTVATQPGILGDVVLARRDVATSYHLAVTVDDHLQGVTLVTRGRDLVEATHVHRLLQALLDLNVPDWHHHRLLVNERGERLAKRDGAASLAALRDGGATPDDIRRRLGMDWLGVETP